MGTSPVPTEEPVTLVFSVEIASYFWLDNLTDEVIDFWLLSPTVS